MSQLHHTLFQEQLSICLIKTSSLGEIKKKRKGKPEKDFELQEDQIGGFSILLSPMKLFSALCRSFCVLC